LKSYKDKVRVICHALRMGTMVGVDPVKMADLSSRIRALPTAERIASMDHGDVLDLSKRLERLLFDIDRSKNSRTTEQALRHRIDKGLPPRMPPILASIAVPSVTLGWLDRALAGSRWRDDGRLSPF
jgi:hypothetical protein